MMTVFILLPLIGFFYLGSAKLYSELVYRNIVIVNSRLIQAAAYLGARRPRKIKASMRPIELLITRLWNLHHYDLA